MKGLVHSSETRDGAKETRRSTSVESVDSDAVDNVSSSSEYDEQRRRPAGSKQDDLWGILTRTNSSSSEGIDGASQGEADHDGARLNTVMRASLSTLIVMVKELLFVGVVRKALGIFMAFPRADTATENDDGGKFYVRSKHTGFPVEWTFRTNSDSTSHK